MDTLRQFAAVNRVSKTGVPYRGGVIVQRMIDADFAGVCLTRDERTGRGDTLILEMTAGGNETITGGTIVPDRFVVDRLTGDILEADRRCPALRQMAPGVGGLVQEFLTLEAKFGKPLDIEWAVAADKLYILQARPVANAECGMRNEKQADTPPSSIPHSAFCIPHSEDGWRAWLALNASTGALLAAILLVGMGSEVWLPLMSQYLKLLGANVLLIALYGCSRDLLDAISFYLGGTLAARFNTRRALLFFNASALLGLILLLVWPNPLMAVFIALPFVGTWNSIAGPATLRVVGDSLSTERRSMAFSLQSIQKRVSSLLAYGISGLLVLLLGGKEGVRAGVALSVLLVGASLLMQFRYMRTAVADQQLALRRPWTILRRFDPQLRQLLVSDVLARWCEGMGREFLILYCLPLIVTALALPVSPESTDFAESLYVWVLLAVMNATSLLLYVPIGHFASKAGAAKKPFIGVTFVLFALFPLALVLLGPTLGLAGLILAFVVGGLKEVGEPARKAMITELAPADCRTQAIGVYWASRSLAIMLAPLAGGLLWYYVSAEAMLWTSAALGMAGAALFYLKFTGATVSRSVDADSGNAG